MNILKIAVVTRPGHSDSISVYTALPGPFPAYKDDLLVLKFEALKGSGVDYVRNNFRIEPEVVNIS